MRRASWPGLPVAVLALAALGACAREARPHELADSWRPPAGVPEPPFGIREQAGPPTHFVDDTSPDATDVDNPRGTALRPRRSVPAELPAGAVVEVRGGPYQLRRATWTAAGTAAAPVFVRGVSSPLIGGDELHLAGSYLVVEGFVFDGIGIRMHGARRVCLRHSEVRGFSPHRNSAAIATGGADLVIYDDEIHHNGDALSPREVDVHGIKLGPGDSGVFVLDSRAHHNGGDAVQVGDARSHEPWAERVFVARNELHEDRENGVDVKQARDVVIAGNRIWGYAPTSSSEGEAVVVHDGPERVWVVGNDVSRAARGVACTGAREIFVIGNLIHEIDAPGAAHDASSLYGPHAILVYATARFVALLNTIHDVAAGIAFASGGRAEIVDNVVAGLRRASHHVALGSGPAARSHLSHDLFASPARIEWGAHGSLDLSALQRAVPGACDGCLEGDPLFVDPANGDLRLQAASPAVDAGVEHEVLDAFRSLYGAEIRTDLDGVARPQGRATDIGAFERPR